MTFRPLNAESRQWMEMIAKSSGRSLSAFVAESMDWVVAEYLKDNREHLLAEAKKDHARKLAALQREMDLLMSTPGLAKDASS